MYVTDKTLDDLLRRVFTRLLASKSQITSSRGRNTEISGALLRLTNPRARLSRTEGKGTVFSCIGEVLWYFAKRNDLNFIRHYVSAYAEDAVDGVVRSGYGPRLFKWKGTNQVDNVVKLLRKKPTSKRAVIQLFDANDLRLDLRDDRNKEVPCTCFLQFLIRGTGLDMITSMRSNDAFLGLPHDIFAFTMIQEYVATKLKLRLGVYRHFVGSLHLYDEHRVKAQRYLDEGFQPTLHIAMPPMPVGDQDESIKRVLLAEEAIRNGRKVNVPGLGLPDYWADIVRLLQAFSARTKGDGRMLTAIKSKMSTKLYDTYIEKRRSRLKTAPKQRQLVLGFDEDRPDEDERER